MRLTTFLVASLALLSGTVSAQYASLPPYTSQAADTNPTATIPGYTPISAPSNCPPGTDICTCVNPSLVKLPTSTRENVICGPATGVSPTTSTSQPPITQPPQQQDPCTLQHGPGVITQQTAQGLVCVRVTPGPGTTQPTTTFIDLSTKEQQEQLCKGQFTVTVKNCKATQCLMFQKACKVVAYAVTPLPTAPVIDDEPKIVYTSKQEKAQREACMAETITKSKAKQCKKLGYPVYDPAAAQAVAAAKALCLQANITAKQKKSCQKNGYPTA